MLEALKVAEVGDRVRTAAETIYQALIEAELTEVIGAAAHERSENRTNQRNGHRTRTLTTTAGDLELRIPKLRTEQRGDRRNRRRHGSFIPSTNAVESMISIARDHSSSVKRWRDGTMALRWCAAGMVEAGKQFRLVNGHLHLRALRGALERHTADSVGPNRYGPTETAA